MKRLMLYICICSFLSCNSQNEKTTHIQHDNSYIGEWISIKQKDGKYIHCKELNKNLRASSTLINDHDPLEDNNFKIDHQKNTNSATYLYQDSGEINFYKFKWIDKAQGIAEWQLNKYSPELYVNKNLLYKIVNENCEKNDQDCNLNNVFSDFFVNIKAFEYQDEKKKTYPISVGIFITSKNNKPIKQEIYFEPNSWTMYSHIPCENFFVNDYNFDGLNDFAFVWDEGGNAEESYEYYFQDKAGQFSIDTSFPLQHGALPKNVNSKAKTITIKNPVGCCKMNTVVYQYKNGKWVILSSVQENI